MNISKAVLLPVLLAFLAFSIWAVATGGSFAEISTAFLANPWTLQVSLDLVLALSLVSVWLWRDARSRGANPVPWLVATLFTGSIAPLFYLLLRPDSEGHPS